MREIDEAAGESLPPWARDILGGSEGDGTQDGRSTARSTGAIMERVRREPRPRRTAPLRPPLLLSPPMRASRWTRRGLPTPFGAAALAGVLGLMLSVRAVATPGGGRPGPGMTLSASVIGDTVMPSLGDTVRDTLRIVEFVLRGPATGAAVRRADVIGDFNDWRRGATALAQRTDGSWYARVVVPRDAVRFAYAVNDEPGPGRHLPPQVMRARIDSI